MVVDDVGQVIGRVAVRLQHDEVVEGAVLEGNITVDKVVELSLPLQRDFKAHHGCDSVGQHLLLFRRGQLAAVTVIAGLLLAGCLLLAYPVESLGGAVAVVGIALRYESPGGFFIEVESL